jgi:3-dehydroquinate synthase
VIRRFTLQHPRGTTRLVYGQGAHDGALAELAAWAAGRRLFLVTTPTVWRLHGAALSGLREAAAASFVLEVPEGEAAKSGAVAQELWSSMAKAGGKRDSRLVAFGGGSVGDLAGFVAGTFLRGLELAQLPTTLLAQVDASVGGKTAIDLPEAKNAVGLFHHPRFVVAETAWLATLPPRQLRDGLVEAVKMAFLLSPRLFARIEADIDRLLHGELERLAELAAAAAALKAEVVSRDPEEGGDRKLLNFGHTLGHAFEAAAQYRDLSHGEAVAHGMKFALRLARRRGLPAADAERLEKLLARFPLSPLPRFDLDALWAHMGRDKKARECGIGWVLPARLGEGHYDQEVAPEIVLEELGGFLAVSGVGGV